MICRLCLKDKLEVLFTIPKACPNISMLFEEPLEIEAKKLAVYQCPYCDFVQLTEESKGSVEYEDYFMAATLSSQMQDCQRLQSETLSCMASKNSLRRVLEIGCGDGSFIKHLLNENFEVTGIEPSKKFYSHAKRVHSDVLNMYMEDSIPGAPYDIIVAREVLEHIYDIHLFLSKIQKNIKDDGLLMIQVPRFETILEETRLQMFFFDHPNYFSEETLCLALELNGFVPEEVDRDMGGEYTTVYARKRPKEDSKVLFNQWLGQVSVLRKQIDKHLTLGQRVVMWGAGGKGLSTLAAMEIKPQTELYLVDDDEMKIGKYTPITNLLVRDTKEIKEINPIVVVILADAYRKEIQQKLTDIGFNGSIIFLGGELS